jgi:hypothetical protein
MTTPRQLKERFPYMFAGQNIGFSFYRGWLALFENLCQDIDALLGQDKRGFHWVQLKEKFGSARFYWDMKGYANKLHVSVISEKGVLELGPHHPDSNSPAGQIEALVRAATAATRSRCIVCGEAATLDQSDSYVLVLCEAHARQRRLGKLDRPWFSDEEGQ